MEQNKQHHHLSLNLRIDWSEQDLFGHVNNVSFFKYTQAARVNFWEQIPNFDRFSNDRIGPMLASAKCDFKSPLFYPGKILINTSVDFVGNSSFGLRHEIKNDKGETVAVGRDIIVYFDFNKDEKLALNELCRNHLAQFLNQENLNGQAGKNRSL